MKIDYSTGRIAYHAYLIRQDGGLDFVQFDFDGSVESTLEVRLPALLAEGETA